MIVHIANILSGFFPLIEGSQKDRLPQKGGHGCVPAEPLLENPDKKVIFPLSDIFLQSNHFVQRQYYIHSTHVVKIVSLLSSRMHRVQSRALTCLHSILSTMDAESLGGAEALQGAAQHLSTLVFGAAGLAF